eukprot:Blabericola_migrator_1__2023@NODE_1551_length_4301_cov_90_086207_g1016_i0_p2_GENE_NODE_1551_length_4301_cov_90_086207_g1016_i0NODE_1551_length_4301_cov_90_086207_g1016_i0_p2_ORF_typecomplete_len384_score49_08_NODE_1551_length_4301_cov_90_086207_g1016_i030974248
MVMSCSSKTKLCVLLILPALSATVDTITEVTISTLCPDEPCATLKDIAANGLTRDVNFDELFACYEAAVATSLCTIESHSVTLKAAPVEAAAGQCDEGLYYTLNLTPPPYYSMFRTWEVKIPSKNAACQLKLVDENCNLVDDAVFRIVDDAISSRSVHLASTNLLMSGDAECADLVGQVPTVNYTTFPLRVNGFTVLNPPEGDCLKESCLLPVGHINTSDTIVDCYQQADCHLTSCQWSARYNALLDRLHTAEVSCNPYAYCYTLESVEDELFSMSKFDYVRVTAGNPESELYDDCNLYHDDVLVMNGTAGASNVEGVSSELLKSSLTLYSNDMACSTLVGGRVSVEVFGTVQQRGNVSLSTRTLIAMKLHFLMLCIALLGKS